MINRENLVKIGRAGGKTSNRETPDQIGRVGISVNTSDWSGQELDLGVASNHENSVNGIFLCSITFLSSKKMLANRRLHILPFCQRVHARCFRGRQWLPQLRRYVLRSIVHFIYLHSAVNKYSKSWFCEILRNTFRDGCRCLRTKVN